MTMRRWMTAGGLLMVTALAACSGTEGPQGPGPMLADNVCAQLRGDLNAMDKRGVPGLVDARNNGKKLAPAQDGEATRYNQVLDQYLGGQCASEARYKAKAGIPPSRSARRASADSDSDSTTASIPRTQVKRRKPVSEDETSGVTGSERPAKSASTDRIPSLAERRKTSRSADKASPVTTGSTSEPTQAKASSSDAAPAPSAVKAESGLPSAPAPVKSERSETPSADKKD